MREDFQKIEAKISEVKFRMKWTADYQRFSNQDNFRIVNYHTHAIITRILYTFYPIFHCGLYCRVASVTDKICTKQGNSSISGSKVSGL